MLILFESRIVGIGGGTYAERGMSQSKRADVFDEPQAYKLPVGSMLAIGFLAAIGYSIAPRLFEAMNEVTGPTPTGLLHIRLFEVLQPYLPAITTIMVILVLAATGLRAWLNAMGAKLPAHIAKEVGYDIAMMYAALSTARGQRTLHFVASVEKGPVQRKVDLDGGLIPLSLSGALYPRLTLS